MSSTPAEDRPPVDAPAGGERRYERYWDRSKSGVRLISRPIVVDGLRTSHTSIELAPRIREVDGQLVDDSYHAVEHAAVQFFQKLTLDQLVLATVALQVHMRKHKEHLEKKKRLQERWTELARRVKKQRVEEERIRFEEERLDEKRAEVAAAGAAGASRAQLLEIEAAELAERRVALVGDQADSDAQWAELEEADEELLKDAPRFEQTEDLKHPYVLTLIGPGRPTQGERKRSPATAMHALVEALQKPLSRTDQLLLEIALRRSLRAYGPRYEPESDAWEKTLFRDAEAQFLEAFPWAERYLKR